MDLAKVFAFLLVTATTSLVPGPSMLFVMGQAMRRGARAGWLALAGLQLGYWFWWALAAVGLGTLATQFPRAFLALALGGVLYLAWLGIEAIRHSFALDDDAANAARQPSTHAFRDGVAVAVGNPKALVYMVAILPPFIDPAASIPWQIAILAVVAMAADVAIGALYISAGRRLARAMQRPATRRWIDRGTGIAYLLIAAAIAAEMVLRA